jgi:hypothetical protein
MGRLSREEQAGRNLNMANLAEEGRRAKQHPTIQPQPFIHPTPYDEMECERPLLFHERWLEQFQARLEAARQQSSRALRLLRHGKLRDD